MDPFLGQIIMFAGNFAPRGWALCDGQLLPIAANQALFSILGTTYGGDGKTTFALPDLRGRVAIHPGQGPGLTPRRLGEKAGTETVSMTVNNLPPHNPAMNVVNGDAKAATPAGNLPGNAQTQLYSSGQPSAQMNAQAIGNTGEGQPVPVVQPFECVNYIIALQGIFPSRE
jgi:microcystin-dependent protein